MNAKYDRNSRWQSAAGPEVKLREMGDLHLLHTLWALRQERILTGAEHAPRRQAWAEAMTEEARLRGLDTTRPPSYRIGLFRWALGEGDVYRRALDRLHAAEIAEPLLVVSRLTGRPCYAHWRAGYGHGTPLPGRDGEPGPEDVLHVTSEPDARDAVERRTAEALGYVVTTGAGGWGPDVRPAASGRVGPGTTTDAGVTLLQVAGVTGRAVTSAYGLVSAGPAPHRLDREKIARDAALILVEHLGRDHGVAVPARADVLADFAGVVRHYLDAALGPEAT